MTDDRAEFEWRTAVSAIPFFQPSPFRVGGGRWNAEMRPDDGQCIDRWLLETGWTDAMSETNDERERTQRTRKPWTGSNGPE